MVFLNGTVKQAKPLPEARYGHCIVKYHDQIILMGGKNEKDDETSTVWSFNNQDEFAVTIEPNMTHPRSDHVCAIFNSDTHGGRPVVVVVGYVWSKEIAVWETEIWDFTVAGSKWENHRKSVFFKYITIFWTFNVDLPVLQPLELQS